MIHYIIVTACIATAALSSTSSAFAKFPAYERILNANLKYGTDWGFEPLLSDEELEKLKSSGIDGEPIRFIDIEVAEFNPKAIHDDNEHSWFSVIWVKNKGDFAVDTWNYATYLTEEAVHAHTAESYYDPFLRKVVDGPNFRILDVEFSLHKGKPIYTVIFVRNEGDEEFVWDWVPAMLSFAFENQLAQNSVVVINANPIETVSLGIVDIEVHVEKDELTGAAIVWQCGVLIENPGTTMEIFNFAKWEKYQANGEHLIDVEKWSWPGSLKTDHSEYIGIRVSADMAQTAGEFYTGIYLKGIDELATGILPRRIIDFDPGSLSEFFHPKEQAPSPFGRHVLTLWDATILED